MKIKESNIDLNNIKCLGSKQGIDDTFKLFICENAWKHGYNSAEDLAKCLHISKQTLSNIINNKTKSSYPMIIAICWIFNILDKENIDKVYEIANHRIKI